MEFVRKIFRFQEKVRTITRKRTYINTYLINYQIRVSRHICLCSKLNVLKQQKNCPSFNPRRLSRRALLDIFQVRRITRNYPCDSDLQHQFCVPIRRGQCSCSLIIKIDHFRVQRIVLEIGIEPFPRQRKRLSQYHQPRGGLRKGVAFYKFQ